MSRNPDPRPVGSITDPMPELCEAIRLHIRRFARCPVHIFVTHEGVIYPIKDDVKHLESWKVEYADGWVGCFTKGVKGYQLRSHFERYLLTHPEP